MKKAARIILKLIITIIAAIGIFIGIFLVSNYISRLNLEKKLKKKSKICKQNLHITDQPKISLRHFNNADLSKIEVQIIRNNNTIKDTVILGTNNQEYPSIKIPFTNFLKTDTILVKLNDKLIYYISDFVSGVSQQYGMFGPVAVSDCKLIESYTINDNKHSSTIIRYLGILNTEKNTRRISYENKDYSIYTSKFIINEKQADSIGHILMRKRNKAGDCNNLGLEINADSSYYLKGDYNEERDELEIIKINANNGKLIKGLKNYPIENKY